MIRPCYFYCMCAALSWLLTMQAGGTDPKRTASSRQGVIKPEFFALNGVGYFHYRDSPEASQTAKRKMALMKGIGAASDRCDFWWSVLEPKRGTWDWRKGDWLMDFYSRQKMDALPILSYSAIWSPDRCPATPDDIRDYANYVFLAVNRYKDKVKCWEVWNEPNIPTFWKPEPNVAAYSLMLKAAYEAAHKADPGCVIVGGATSETDINWFLGIAEHGALHCMDVASFHPYSMADGPDEMDLGRQIDNMRTLLNRNGLTTMPLWITEMGWQADPAKPKEVDAQARYMAQSYAIAAARGVERLYWFNLQDWMEDGKLMGWGLASKELRLKRSSQAFKVMRSKLEGKKFRGYALFAEAKPGTESAGYVFDDMMIAWAPRGRSLSIICKASAVTDIYGTSIPVKDNNVVLTDSPLYVDLADKGFPVVSDPPRKANLLVNSSFDMDGAQPYAWHRGMFYGGDDKGGYGVSTTCTIDGGRAAVLSKTENALWQSYPVPAMPGEEYTLRASIKADHATGENCVQILYLSGPGWGYKGGPKTESITGSTEGWKLVEVKGTVPHDADVVRVNLVSKNNTGTAYFDNLTLMRKE